MSTVNEGKGNVRTEKGNDTPVDFPSDLPNVRLGDDLFFAGRCILGEKVVCVVDFCIGLRARLRSFDGLDGGLFGSGLLLHPERGHDSRRRGAR